MLSTPHKPHSAFRVPHSAFTLTELIVVISIIALLLAAAMPSLSSTWQQRKAANAEALIKGSILSARMKGLNKAERGLFFMVDANGQQLVFDIVAEPYDAATEGSTGLNLNEEAVADRFTVQAGNPVRLPSPFRVTPRSLVDDDAPGSGVPLWNNSELTQQDYMAAPGNLRPHRNFFTIIFTPDGQLRVNRFVLIHDPDLDANGAGGDLTGLNVPATVTQWYDDSGGTGPLSGNAPVPNLVADTASTAAINFPSVDGLLVYDDSLFKEIPAGADKRKFLLRSAQPLYISRLSGQVIAGPLGENQ